MLTDPYITPEDGQASKRVKLEDGTFAETEATDKDSAEGAKDSFMLRPATKRTLDEFKDSASFDCKGYFGTSYEFIALKPRKKYYEEYKKYPEALKTHFSSKKNSLRRMLSYGRPWEERVWEVEDLDNPAVLERAMELMLRVRLGSQAVEMLPYPLIDFSLVAPEKRERLEQILAGLDVIDQDIEEASEEGSKSKHKNRLDALGIRGIRPDMSLSERDKYFDDTTAGGSTSTTKRLEKEEREKRALSELRSEDLQEVEGADTEDEDNDSDDGDDDNNSNGDDNDDDGDDPGDDPDDDQQGSEASEDASSQNTGTEGRDDQGDEEHGDKDGDEDDGIVIISSRRIGKANAESNDVKVKTEEIDDATPHAINTTDAVAEKSDDGPRVKRESPPRDTDTVDDNACT